MDTEIVTKCHILIDLYVDVKKRMDFIGTKVHHYLYKNINVITILIESFYTQFNLKLHSISSLHLISTITQ